ncbi:hypothetical protein [Neptuniibacter sp. QD37_11]|uniref:hypothetical protein n=1 Tax=Neptuniibacter sp. QD37_11 TaxID=3398209 RepID=UPI0039F496D8
MPHSYQYNAEEDVVEVLGPKGRMIKSYAPSPAERWAFEQVALQSKMLESANKLSETVREIVGGTDFVTGLEQPTCLLSELDRKLSVAKDAVDAYDQLFIDSMKSEIEKAA